MKHLLLVLALIPASSALTADSAQSAFWSALQQLCGKSFAGEVVEDKPDPDPRFAGKALIAHVRDCSDSEIRIPLHVGEDRSRTWILTRTDTGLRLKHDHRHQDGSEDAITQYGGDTRDAGDAGKQRFHADAHTAQLIPAAATNVWTFEIEPGAALYYRLHREGTPRAFGVRFDLGNAVPTPPPVWGWTDAGDGK